MNTLERLTQRFHQLNEQIEQAMALMKSDSIELLGEAAKEMFSAAPEITKVYWVQQIMKKLLTSNTSQKLLELKSIGLPKIVNLSIN